ncbi:BAG family molecular chaperone regulator 1-like isoform X2 [Andrographis paniculata]|uniref:BAG family molecular chaperone regulator 1-like isoform X2 n=1 Tax=Andrographis paniculata TaxID=175694 RepID=UPI0021E77833|nr:BAG family molecular chaperone regulator 1-like isoform X2 [Andrographis paniculata]
MLRTTKSRFAGGCWEVRPGGMLVQKRNSDANLNSIPVPKIRVRVRHGSSSHEVTVSSQASFGELKRIVAERTGVKEQDQKVSFREKERDSNEFLDVCEVRDGSKVVMVEDALRRLESTDKAAKAIAAVRFEVDNLAKQVASAEMEIVGKGRKVVETDLLNLIELLMTQLINLDGIDAQGDVKLQRRMQFSGFVGNRTTAGEESSELHRNT